MITTQDIEKMSVAELRKEAQQRGIDMIQSDERESVKPRLARKSELIKALKLYCKPEIKKLEIEMFQLSEEEKIEVQAALEVSGMSLLELAKSGLLMKARRLNTDYEKVASMSAEQRRNTTLAGAANANLRATADRIVQWNHAQYNNNLRVFLNASILRNLTGSNLNTIKDFLSVYRTPDEFMYTPEEHNQHYGLTENDNRKGRDEFGNKIRISELVKLPIPQKTEDKEVVSPVETPAETQSAVENLTPEKQFSQRIDRLESEAEIKEASETLMEELIKVNSSKGFASFKKLVSPFRKEIESLRLRSHNSEAKSVSSGEGMKPDNWLKTHSELPKGAEYNEKGNIISYPVHVALKYLSPELYKERFPK